MQAVVLCGGRGVRLRPLTDSLPKVMIPVAGKPLVEYVVEKLEALELDAVLVVGYLKEALMRHFGSRVKYCFQERPLGTAHALLMAEPLVSSDRFLVVNGDLFFTDDLSWVKVEEPVMMSVYPVEDASRYGAVEVVEGRVVDIAEKARRGPGLVNAGIYLFSREVFEAARRVKPSPRGEYELTDAVKELMRMGVEVKARRLDGYWRDVARLEDLEEVEEYVRSQRNVKAKASKPLEGG
jgi:NDP-sugar pyrophosphorylase family protein